MKKLINEGPKSLWEKGAILPKSIFTPVYKSPKTEEIINYFFQTTNNEFVNIPAELLEESNHSIVGKKAILFKVKKNMIFNFLNSKEEVSGLKLIKLIFKKCD